MLMRSCSISSVFIFGASIDASIESSGAKFELLPEQVQMLRLAKIKRAVYHCLSLSAVVYVFTVHCWQYKNLILEFMIVVWKFSLSTGYRNAVSKQHLFVHYIFHPILHFVSLILYVLFLHFGRLIVIRTFLHS